MKKIKLLYAEDDETLAYLTKDNLEQNNYEVHHCADGKTCLELFKQGEYDLCILDILLPRLDGFEITTEIRKLNPDIPVVFLSAKILKEDRIKGLKLGADDYLVKPFSIEELLLKIEIFLKRSKKSGGVTGPRYSLGRYLFDAEDLSLMDGTLRISLTQREAQVLKFLADNRNRVLRREEILKSLWGDDDYFMGRSLDVFISRLRKHMAGDKNIGIENVHGVGFKFTLQEGE